MPETITTVIGFDYGTDWIGVAVGQTLTGQARPLAAIKNGDWHRIARVIDDWRPQKLVVGLPLNMQGEAQTMTRKAQRFARQLEGRHGIETELVDERLTTREAYLLALDGDDKKSKTEIDSISAALITESWLRGHLES